MPSPDTQAAGDLTGRALAHFQVESKIGEGGMGVVYRAVDTRTGRPSALKVLSPRHAADPARRRKLLREARVAASIQHPNVAAVYEVAEADGQVFIAMELVRGDTLRAVLSRGKLPLADAVSFGLAIARGVARAHEKGVIHCDLKPENVVVTSAGDVKVLDFGLAKLHEGEGSLLYEAETASNVTLDGKVTGTPGYMAPEQVTGKEVSFRADVFSFGVILYEMLAGEQPFKGNSVMDVLIASTRDAPRSLGGDMPPAIEAIVSRCLAKRPADRFGTAAEIVRELEAIDPSPVPGAGAPGRRRRRWAPLEWIAPAMALVSVVVMASWPRSQLVESKVLLPTAAGVSANPAPAPSLVTPQATLPLTTRQTPTSPAPAVATAVATSAPPRPTATVRAPRVRPPLATTPSSPFPAPGTSSSPPPLERGTSNIPIIE